MQFIEHLESRALFSATVHVKAAPTATQVADLQAITDARATLAQDTSTRTQTIRTDLAAIPTIRITDLATITEDIAKIRADRGNTLVVAADAAQLRTDRVKLVVDINTARAQYVSDVRSSNLQLATDRAALRVATVKYRSDLIHHI